MDSIERITLATPFPIGPVNLYLIAGDEPALVDVGPRVPGFYEGLVAALAERGYEPREIKWLIVSHSHADHSGLARRFAEESGARLCTHESNVPYFASYSEEWDRRIQFYIKFFQITGAPAEALATGGQRYSVVKGLAEGATVDVALRDGDRLALGSGEWQVLHTPGHSAGSICLYQAETRRLISGDTLLRDVSSNPVLEPPTNGEGRARSLAQYLDSLARLEALPIDITYPGHGEIIHDHRALIAERRAFHERRKEQVYAAVERGLDTLYAIAVDMFPGLPPFELPLALFEVLGHADLLEAEGRVGYVRENGVVRIRPRS